MQQKISQFRHFHNPSPSGSVEVPIQTTQNQNPQLDNFQDAGKGTTNYIQDEIVANEIKKWIGPIRSAHDHKLFREKVAEVLQELFELVKIEFDNSLKECFQIALKVHKLDSYLKLNTFPKSWKFPEQYLSESLAERNAKIALRERDNAVQIFKESKVKLSSGTYMFDKELIKKFRSLLPKKFPLYPEKDQWDYYIKEFLGRQVSEIIGKFYEYEYERICHHTLKYYLLVENFDKYFTSKHI